MDNICRKAAEGVDYMTSMLNKADEEGRDLTEQEEAEYTYLDGKVQNLRKEEERTKNLIADEDAAKRVRRNPPRPTDPRSNIEVGNEEFRTLGEWLAAVRFNPTDPRLDFRPMEKRQQSMGVGTEGGFAVPTQFLPELKMVDPQAAIFRPRCTVIPAGDPPDAMISMPTLDQTAAQNMYGGMAVSWISEGGTKPETDLKLLEVCLTPHEVAGYTVITDKLLRNWGAAEATVSNMLRLCVRGTEDTAFLSGTGAGQPQGVTNAPARINITRAGAGAIAFADVYGMLARMKMGGSPVWIGSQTILPQLITMVDAGTNSVWLPGTSSSIGAGASNSPPSTLFGYPLLFNDRSPALGTAGDLIFADLSYYLIKDGSGPFVAVSPHVYFTSNRSVIKIFWNVDGQPWLSAPIPLEGSAANTVSPFVVLN